MSYTTIDKVAAMFPAFIRGGAMQKPADSYIQIFIDDVAGELDAILQRRFAEIISDPAHGGTFSAWINQLAADGLAILQKINRYGAAAQLGQTLASFGVAGTRDLAKSYGEQYEQMKDDLDARKSDGEPLPSGPYDHLFDPYARTETPRAALVGIAGGDMPAGQTPEQQGMSNVFGKFDKRGT
jgi:hypothetical protein